MRAAASSRFLTFEVGTQLYALHAEDVAEVMRVPPMARVPQGPPALLGIANLRGSVLPVASLHVMLGQAAHSNGTSRAIVLDIGAPVAIVVDAVANLESGAALEQQDAGSRNAGDQVAHTLGAFAVAGGQRVARVLDVRALLDSAFARRARVAPRERQGIAPLRARQQLTGTAAAQMLVTFEVAGQEYALPLEAVREILPAAADVATVAHADSAVLGITAVRDRLLPLLSLRALLGFAAPAHADARQKIVVTRLGDSLVGLVADRARAILAAEDRLVDPVPPVLAARAGGESRIRAVFRGEGGRRLVSILSPEQLLRNEVMQQLTAGGRNSATDTAQPARATGTEVIYLVFRLGGDEFGLPIETVVEVAQVPEQITRVPRTPKFLEGVVNLRGEVLPIVDQRRRFEMPPADAAVRRRLVVIRTERHRAGVIVDGVSDVLRATAEQIEPPPELTDATSRLVKGVLNLQNPQRLVLLLDPAELLTRAEQGLLDTFQAARKKADA